MSIQTNHCDLNTQLSTAFRREAATIDGRPGGFSVQIYPQLREFLKVTISEIELIELGTHCSNDFLEFLAFRLKALFVASDEITKRPKNMVQAKRMDRADVIVSVVTRVHVIPYPAFDFMNGRICVCNASD
jgi:hypothetical protein